MASKHEFEWKDILNSIKGHYNTLYGVLKIANAEINHGAREISIKFGFAFHQKQLQQPKNIDRLNKVLEQLSGGQAYKLSVETDKSKVPKTQNQDGLSTRTEALAQEKPKIEDISNIFSGAELIE